MRILCAIAHVQNGGGQVTQSVRIMKELEKKHTLRLLTLRVDDRPADTPKDTRFVGDFSFPKGVIQMAKAIRKQAKDFDVIQCFDGFYSFPAAVMARKKPYFLRMGMDSPSFLAEKGVPLPGAFAWFQMLPIGTGDCERFIVNSKYLRKVCRRYDPAVIPNGFRIQPLPSTEEKEASKKKLSLPQGKPILLFTGKIIPRKRLGAALSALRKRDALLVALGEIADKPYFSRLQREYHDVWEKVIFPGEVTAKEVGGYLSAADIFLFPSSLEGQPNSVLEAMGAGLPVVISRTAPHEEIVEDGKDGFLFSDAGELNDKLGLLCMDGSLRRKMGMAARAYFEANHDIARCAEQYVALYRKAFR